MGNISPASFKALVNFSDFVSSTTPVDTLIEDITAEKMVQNIISIGKNLELAILAEGVETKAQEAKLKTLGCDRFQGYLYAKPLSYEDLKAFVKEQKNLYM